MLVYYVAMSFNAPTFLFTLFMEIHNRWKHLHLSSHNYILFKIIAKIFFCYLYTV